MMYQDGISQQFRFNVMAVTSRLKPQYWSRLERNLYLQSTTEWVSELKSRLPQRIGHPSSKPPKRLSGVSPGQNWYEDVA
jgi:hypothetical protein